MNDPLEHARAVLREHRELLLARPNVVAVGVGHKTTGGQRTDAVCIVCSVARKLPAQRLSARDVVPVALDALPTDVMETGAFQALQSRTGRLRPAPGGVSIGHRDVTAGTLGCLVRRGGERFILSNNHVLANSNAGAAGDPVLQPGVHDGGRFPEDQIATLADFVPIRFAESPSDCSLARGMATLLNGFAGLLESRTRFRTVRPRAVENRVDAAIARPGLDADVSDEILELGAISGLAKLELGSPVRKSGRTTGLTEGRIEQIDVTVDVSYGAGRIARFTEQLMAGAMSQGGDSGSAVLDAENRLGALLFAGSDTTTVLNPIDAVFSALDLSL
jgi:hypothetical protein